MTFQGAPPFKHVGSLCVILFFSLFRPAAVWSAVPVSAAPLAVLAAWLLLFYKIKETIGYRAFFYQHQKLLLLIAGYFALCGASLIANYHRYPDMTSFVRWGLTFPIIQSALVACGFLFTLPQNQTGVSVSRTPLSGMLVLFISALIPAVTFWQIIDNEAAYALYQYAVAGDIGNSPYVIRSVLATSTDLGAISAIITVAALVSAIQAARHNQWLLVSLILGLSAANAISGTLSGSRGFYMSIGAGLIIGLHQLLGGRFKLALTLPLSLIFLGFLVLLFAPEHLFYKLASLSPLFLAFATGVAPTKTDLTLNHVGAALGDRADLWSRAIAEVTANPWLGISNGGYRLLNESLGETPIHNVHNAYLQLAIDAGVVGLILGTALIAILLKQSKNRAQAPIYAATLTGLLVDNFADHSVAWITIATYTTSNAGFGLPKILTGQHRVRPIIIALAMSSVALLSVLLTQYQHNQRIYQSMDLDEQIIKARPYLNSDYWNSAPTLITNGIDNELKLRGESRSKGNIAFYPSIASSDYCAYAYPNTKLLYLVDEHQDVASGKFRTMGKQWNLSFQTTPTCENSLKDPRQIPNWISNYHRHYGERLRQENANILLTTNYIAYFSPIFVTFRPQTLTLTINSEDLTELKPTLVVYYFDARTGTEVSVTDHTAAIGESHVNFALPPTASGSGFIKLKLKHWHKIHKKRLSPEVLITDVNLTPL